MQTPIQTQIQFDLGLGCCVWVAPTHPHPSFRVSRAFTLLSGGGLEPCYPSSPISSITELAAGAIELTQGDDVVRFRSTTSEKETDVRASD